MKTWWFVWSGFLIFWNATYLPGNVERGEWAYFWLHVAFGGILAVQFIFTKWIRK